MKTYRSQKLTFCVVPLTEQVQNGPICRQEADRSCLWQGRRVQEGPEKRLPRSMGLFRVMKCFKLDCGTGSAYLKP